MKPREYSGGSSLAELLTLCHTYMHTYEHTCRQYAHVCTCETRVCAHMQTDVYRHTHMQAHMSTHAEDIGTHTHMGTVIQ